MNSEIILDVLSPTDVRLLIECEDEYDRRGGFVRIFPTPTTMQYQQYFKEPRYTNLLLQQWTIEYGNQRDVGK